MTKNVSKRMLLQLALLVLNLPLLTGCWVQSVYPFYRDSDVIVDSTLTGTKTPFPKSLNSLTVRSISVR